MVRALSGGSREGVWASTLFQVKKEEIREGRKAGSVSKTRYGSATDHAFIKTVFLAKSYHGLFPLKHRQIEE